MNDQDIPTARPGDRISLQTAQRPVMALKMGEEPNEIQVMGLVPNAPDGARVAIGAGLRAPGPNQTQFVHCALLDPQQALETSAMLATLAVQAAMLRGEPLKAEPSPELLAMARDSGFSIEEAMDHAARAPGQAIMDKDGNAIGKATDGVAVFCAVRMPGEQVGIEGLLGCGSLTMPDGQPWIAVDMRQGGPDDVEAPGANAVMSLENAIAFSNALVDRIQDAAEQPLTPPGKPS